MSPRQFIVPHTLRFQLFVRWRIEEHLTHSRITETLAHHSLHLAGRERSYYNTKLRYPLGTCYAVVVETQSCIEGEPAHEVLTHIEVACHLVSIGTSALFVRCHEDVSCRLVGIVRITIDMLVVCTKGKTVALEESGTLIPRDTRQRILGAEIS